MKASKKFLSVLLVLAMCLSFAAVSAGAEGYVINIEQEQEQDEGHSSEPSGEQPASIPANVFSMPGDGDAPEIVPPDETKPDETKSEEQKPDEPKEDTVAVIKGTNEVYEYSSLDSAISAAAQNATVTLTKSITLSAPLVIGKSVKLDLGGYKVTFANESAAYDSAVTVDDGAAVTLKNGEVSLVKSSDSEGNEYGFMSGLFAADGALTIVDLELNGSAINGSSAMLSCSEDGSVTVISGEFDFDPSDFVADGYTAQETDGVFAVVESSPADPASDEPSAGEPDADEPSADEPSAGEPDADNPGTGKGDTLQSQITADTTGTVTLTEAVTEDITIDKDFSLDLGGKSLTGKITVNAGKTVTVKNGTVSHAAAVSRAAVDADADNTVIENSGNLILEGVVVDGNVALKNGSSLTISDANVEVKGEITVDGTVTGSITAGKFKAAVPAALIPTGYESSGSADSGYTVELKNAAPAGTAAVKDAEGKAYNDGDNYLQYLKGVTFLSSYEGVLFGEDSKFVLNETLSAVQFNGNTLVKDTDYKIDDATKTLTFIFKQEGDAIIADAFEAAPAGENEITFSFANGDNVKIPVFIWPGVEMLKEKYVIGSNTSFAVKLSDAPDGVSFSNSGTESGTAVAAENYTYSGGKLEIKSAYMDKLAVGDRYLGLWYDGMGLMYKIIVRPAPTITPVEANKDNKWLNSNSALSYTVSPNVVSVTVDGNAVDAKNYTVSKENVLSLNSAYLKSLSYGEHTLAVVTDDGTVSVKFTTAPSVVAKNGSNHTKGGSKDLSFVASDAMNEVYVGRTKLKTDYYTISSDGKTITLKASFLNTLKADVTYTITVNGDAGHAATTFRILSPEAAGANPRTGDNGVTLWAALLVLSGSAVAVIVPKRKEN